MKFYSTNKNAPEVSLREAVMNGLAPDGGLYMPDRIPQLPPHIFQHPHVLSFSEVAFEVSKLFFLSEVSEEKLKNMLREAYDFEVPLVKLSENNSVFELFHGPTCAFKDFAARFMSRLLGYFAEQANQEITILVATSGDTGSAVAHGFLNVPGINVVILYPSGKVSPLQEKQLTGMGANIRAIEVQGTFDDCQKMVKQAFMDVELQEKMTLASANSINIARLLPQSFYYVYLSTLFDPEKAPPVVSVPSGNFGNLAAGIIAKRMGAPIARFIASNNDNDVVHQYLQTGEFHPRASVQTLSNAMDVGNPSNMARLLELYDHDVEKMRAEISSGTFSDNKTRDAIKEVFEKYNYIMDPHGAVAYLGLTEYLKEHPHSEGVFVETAHPGKFFEVVEEVIGEGKVELPDQLKIYLDKEKEATLMDNDFEELKGILLG